MLGGSNQSRLQFGCLIKLSSLKTGLFAVLVAVLNSLILPAEAVTLHYSGTPSANIHVNLYSYSPGSSFVLGRDTTAGATGGLDVLLDTDLNIMTVSGFFTTPAEYSIYSANPAQRDTLKGLLGSSISFSAVRQISNYTYNQDNGWFSIGGGASSANIWSDGLLAGGPALHGVQQLNNIGIEGYSPLPVLYGSFFSVLNNIGIEVLLGAQLTYQGAISTGGGLRQAGNSVPEPSTILILLLGLGAAALRGTKTRKVSI